MKANTALKYNSNETTYFSKIRSVEEIDFEITKMIDDAKLNRRNNDFFTLANKIEYVSLSAATKIAYNWRAFTRHFMFTVLTGIGVLADNIRQYSNTSDVLLSVLQTSVNIISDDLNNIDATFTNIAPKGPEGIHYRWWEESILYPLLSICRDNILPNNNTLNPETEKLLRNMSKLSNNYLGSSVQLRVVEAIAMDIALAFRSIFPKLEVNGAKVFKNRDELSWIYTHIKAEVIHHQQVTDHQSGVTQIAISPHEQQEFIILTKELIDSWAGFFNGLKSNLENN